MLKIIYCKDRNFIHFGICGRDSMYLLVGKKIQRKKSKATHDSRILRIWFGHLNFNILQIRSFAQF